MSRRIISSRRDVVHKLKEFGLNAMQVILAAEGRGLQIMIDTFPTMVIINNSITDGQVRLYPSKKNGWSIAGTDEVAKQFAEEFFK